MKEVTVAKRETQLMVNWRTEWERTLQHAVSRIDDIPITCIHKRQIMATVSEAGVNFGRMAYS